MIEGIDIFAPRDSGLPDLSRISAAQIFNGSALAGLNAMKEQHDPYGLLDRPQGTTEAVNKQTTIDSNTGRRVEIRRARVVEEMLNGKSARDRGHRKVSGGDGNYSVVDGPVDQPELPGEHPQQDAKLLTVPPDNWHAPMAPDYVPPSADVESGPSSSLLSPDLLELPKTSWLRKLPTTVLAELKNIYNI